MEHDREDGLCGGSVLTLIGATPDAADTGEQRLQEALDIGVSDAVALCPWGQFQLRVTADKKGLPVTIHDLPHPPGALPAKPCPSLVVWKSRERLR